MKKEEANKKILKLRKELNDHNYKYYVENNPVIYTDPTGHFKFKEIIGTVLSIGFAFMGMPFIGSLIGSAVSTAANGGSFGDFAVGFGVGVAAGMIAGPVAGKLGKSMGDKRWTEIEKIAIRCALCSHRIAYVEECWGRR